MQQTCDQCHGTGLRCYFKGESRFILSQEECPACSGLGYIEVADAEPHQQNSTTLDDQPTDNA